ncbi:MAG: antitoxin Xre/MbcA/ParS toxin-binding domain-containing protein [Thermodesulfobacteriota bacterium]
MATQTTTKLTVKALSNRIDRFSKVFEAAADLHGGDMEATVRWLDRPLRGLEYRKPIDMLESEKKTNEVLGLIWNIGHGVFM